MTEDEDYDALSQKHLASLKRDTRVSLEDATVRAAHKVMAEFKPDWDEKAVLVEEMQRMAKRIGELERGIDFSSKAYEILSKHNDELVEIQREEVKLKIAQAKERNFCHRCGKRLHDALGPVSIHTCCPPQGRTFDDYGNKLP